MRRHRGGERNRFWSRYSGAGCAACFRRLLYNASQRNRPGTCCVTGNDREPRRRSPLPFEPGGYNVFSAAPCVQGYGGSRMNPRASVLVAEDEMAAREALRDLLTDEGYDVICSTDGNQALAIL